MIGKTVVITGASSGIGLETARGLAKLGAHIVAVVRNRDKAAAALEGTGADLVIADLYSLAEVRKAAAEIRARYSRIHVLVNNAGSIGTTSASSRSTASSALRSRSITFAAFLLRPPKVREMLVAKVHLLAARQLVAS